MRASPEFDRLFPITKQYNAVAAKHRLYSQTEIETDKFKQNTASLAHVLVSRPGSSSKKKKEEEEEEEKK